MNDRSAADRTRDSGGRTITTDKQLRDSVEAALEWEPSVDATGIGVTTEQGVITLRGDVKSFSEKEAAERVTLKVHGVKALANDLRVRIGIEMKRTDSEIALAAANALKWNSQVPADRVSVTVSDGWITLKGDLDWNYQRETAERAVRDLLGVLGVSNTIELKPHLNVTDIQAKIEAALKRSAEIDAKRIHVGASDGKVILTGNVRSWTERLEARHAAWAAPGVRDVDDRIAILP